MSAFIYFFPGVPGVSVEMLHTSGVASRYTSPAGLIEHGVTQWDIGPTNSNGAAVCTVPCEYQSEQQIWINCGKFWLGCNKQTMPKPNDLEREIGIQGYYVTLKDQNNWRIPLLKRWSKDHFENALPESYRFINGVPRMCVQPRFEPLENIAQAILKIIVEGNKTDVVTLMHICSELLSVNYRLGMEEISLLGLLDNENGVSILRSALDYAEFQEAVNVASMNGLHIKEVNANE